MHNKTLNAPSHETERDHFKKGFREGYLSALSYITVQHDRMREHALNHGLELLKNINERIE